MPTSIYRSCGFAGPPWFTSCTEPKGTPNDVRVLHGNKVGALIKMQTEQTKKKIYNPCKSRAEIGWPWAANGSLYECRHPIVKLVLKNNYRGWGIPLMSRPRAFTSLCTSLNPWLLAVLKDILNFCIYASELRESCSCEWVPETLSTEIVLRMHRLLFIVWRPYNTCLCLAHWWCHLQYCNLHFVFSH